MDRTAGLKSSCRSWCRRYVYMAFAGTCSYGEDGRTGAGGTVHRTRWTWQSPWFCTGSSTACDTYGNGIRGYFACVYTADGRIFSVDGSGGTDRSPILHQDCMRTDCIFISDADNDRVVYGTGWFEDTVSGQPDRTCYKHDSWSGADPRTGTVSEAWSSRCCNRNSDSSGDCYDDDDPWCAHTKERKCIKRNPADGKDTERISRRTLQDWHSDCNSGYGLLCDFHGTDANGICLRCWSRCHAESRRADWIHFMEYGGWFCGSAECLYCTELWCRKDGPCP